MGTKNDTEKYIYGDTDNKPLFIKEGYTNINSDSGSYRFSTGVIKFNVYRGI